MNTKRRLCLTLVALMLCVALVFGVAACDDTTEEIPSAETDDGLFTNGTFGTTTGSTYPLTPSNWTGAPGSSSSSSSTATPSGSDNLIAGVISVDPDVYSANRRTYGNVGNPSKPEGAEDDNILMVYNKVPTVYKYTSSSITLEPSSYYRLSVWVYTDIDTSADGYSEERCGAYIYVNGAAYAAFEAIDTDNQWRQYTVYIETSDISSQSITVVLSLGNGTRQQNSMTQGYAYFDQVTLENLSDVNEGEEEFTSEDFDALEIGSTVSKYTMKIGDGEFDYTTTTSSPYTASKWTGVAGRGNGSTAPSSSSYVSKGIINAANTSTITSGGTDTPVTVAPNTVGTKMLMINNRRATAYGYRSSAAMRFIGGSDSYYRVSVQVRTTNITGNGARVALTDGSNGSEPYAEISDIVTNGEWTTVSFYIQANQFRSRDIYLELWLGEGGADDTDMHVTGTAFFDGVKLEEITAADYESASESDTVCVTSFRTDSSALDYKSMSIANFGNASGDDYIEGRTNWQTVDTSLTGDDWNNAVSSVFPGLENPGAPVSDEDASVLVINNYLPSSFLLSTVYDAEAKTFTVAPNNCYIISVWVKTQDIESGSGIELSLFSYDPDAKEDERKTELSSFTNINTEDLESYRSANNGDYTEFRFVIKGANDKATRVGLEVSFGSGNSLSPSTHLSGYAFLSTISIEHIDYSEYSSVSTSTVVKSVSLLGSAQNAELSSNGYFNFIDVAATRSQYADRTGSDDQPLEIFDENGDLVNFLGVPTGWTINNSDALDSDETAAGILDITNETLLANHPEFTVGDDFYSSMDMIGVTPELYPNVLAIHSPDYVVYESGEISLSANTYYLVGVWVKTDGSSTVTVSLNASTDSEALTTFTPADSDWHHYLFYVRTGFNSVDATLTIGVASEGVTGSTNTAYFAMANYAAVTESAYNAAEEADTDSDYVTVRSFVVDSFDSAGSLSSVSAPDNWTGSTVDEDASTEEDDFAGGVFNQREGDWDRLGIDPDSAEYADIAAKLRADTATGDTVLGDNVLVINNKIAGAYKFTSSDVTLSGDTYYRISIWVLTYGLDEDDTATLSLKLNNLSYTFGREERTEDDDIARKVNTSTYADGAETVGDWTCYTFYVHTEKDVTPTANMTVQLGFDGAMIDGYAFFDNFSIDTITQEEFEAATGDDMSVATNYSVTFTQEDADAEEDTTDEGGDDTPANTDLIWVWITTGIIGAILIVVVIVVLVKKYTHSRRFTTKKKPTAPVNRSNDRRGDNDRNNSGDRR